MVRPLTGERAKKHATITIDPVLWETFKTVVENKEPDGDTSASSHVETLVKKEVAKITGADPDAAENNERQLRGRLNTLIKRVHSIHELISNRGTHVWDNAEKMCSAYKLNLDFSNTENVTRRMLIDIHRKSSPAQEFIAEQSDTTFSLVIQFLKGKAEMKKVNTELLQVMAKQAGITLEEIKAAKETSVTEEEKCCSEEPNTWTRVQEEFNEYKRQLRAGEENVKRPEQVDLNNPNWIAFEKEQRRIGERLRRKASEEGVPVDYAKAEGAEDENDDE